MSPMNPMNPMNPTHHGNRSTAVSRSTSLARRSVAVIAVIAVIAVAGFAGHTVVSADSALTEWSRWRGPDGTGVAPGANPPASWSEQDNLCFKVEILGAGHASPIVLGNRIYLLTAVKTDRRAEPDPAKVNETAPASGEGAAGASREDVALGAVQDGNREGGGERRGNRGPRQPQEKPSNVYEFLVLALDRHDGKILWTTKVREGVPHEGTHDTGSFAPATPVTDGEHLYAFFGSRGVHALDLDGKILWSRDIGHMTTRNGFGEGASPALHGETLVIPWDHEGDSFVLALDKRTGDEKWRVARDEPTSWTTPVFANVGDAAKVGDAAEVGGTTQVILAGYNASIGYDLATGVEIWRCKGMTSNVIPTPIVAHGMVYLISGFRGSALQAVRLADARGDVTGTPAVVWSYDRGTPYVPSPLLSGRNLYFLKGNSGTISCLDAVTGEPHYLDERLEGVGNVYASLVGAAGRIYVCDREGTVVVLKDADTFEVIATSALGEAIDATPAIVGDAVYVRGEKHLFCFGKTGGSAK